MLPLVGIPKSIEAELPEYRGNFKKEAGYKHISRYVLGLIVNENKTVQGIYDRIVWEEGEEVSRRAMHEAIFEAGWNRKELMKKHRERMGEKHRGRGKEVIGSDWTYSHHERGKEIYGTKRMYDQVSKKMSRYQTVMTAVVSNRERIDGIMVEVQTPKYEEEEKRYLEMTARESYEEMEEVRQRLRELLHYQKNRLEYRKRTEMAVEIVKTIETEGKFPEAHYAFDNGLLCFPLAQEIEANGKYWVSEIEKSRLINWQGVWRRVDTVASELKTQHKESFRHLKVSCRNGEEKEYYLFTKVVRLKKYGRLRLVIVHEQEDLEDNPRFLVTNARHWDGTRVIGTWSYRWSCEIFHEFCKQVTGFESAQLRNEEAVKRHFCLSCLAQSLLQSVPCSGGKSERFAFADGAKTLGQRLYTLSRETLSNLLYLVQGLLAQGLPSSKVLEVLMPA
jgi:ElaB/YqjD/DUF883 family membrane-anchored ribosome-binding protein